MIESTIFQESFAVKLKIDADLKVVHLKQIITAQNVEFTFVLSKEEIVS